MPEDTQIENNNTSDPVNLETHHQDDDFNFEEDADNNTWIPTENMAKLPMEVYCGNLLEPSVRKQILQEIKILPLYRSKWNRECSPLCPKMTGKRIKTTANSSIDSLQLLDPLTTLSELSMTENLKINQTKNMESGYSYNKQFSTLEPWPWMPYHLGTTYEENWLSRIYLPITENLQFIKEYLGTIYLTLYEKKMRSTNLSMMLPIRKKGLVSFPSQIIHPLSDLIHNNNLSKTIGREGIGNIRTGRKTTIKGIRETFPWAVH
jgi:hypothetical protein